MATREINGRIVIEGYASPAKRQLWRVVDGAVRDALTSHPDWVASDEAALKIRNSVVKRVVGAVMSYAETSAWGRSGFSPAARAEAAGPAAVSDVGSGGSRTAPDEREGVDSCLLPRSSNDTKAA